MNKLLTALLLMAGVTMAFNVNAADLTCQNLDGSYVYSAEDTPVYLGFFGRASHPESIMNFSGQYGSSTGTYSVRNITGKYGSSSGEYSANNNNGYTAYPPIIYKNGAFLGYLSVLDLYDAVSLAEIDSQCSFSSTTSPSVAPADLAFTVFDVENGTYSTGDTLVVNTRVENFGGINSGTFRFTYYGSTDRTITSSDYNFGYIEIEDLGVNENYHYNISLQPIPESMPGGEYYIGAILTSSNDGNNSNNSRYDPTPITISGSSSPAFKINSGLNDAWYNPATDGQGFFLTVLPDLELVSLAWFTYDITVPQLGVSAELGSSNHRWLTALGPISGNQVVMDIDIASGGLFDTSTVIQHTSPAGSDGTITLTFDDCYSGTVEYDIPSINQRGTVPIQRVANDNVALCEALSTD